MTKLNEILQQWKDDPAFMSNITRWEVVPTTEGCFCNFPDYLEPQLCTALQRRGVEKLYSHQAAAIDAVRQ
ncbi:MAG: ATP-dependent RNA helicase, partial [Clostridia bacterium]|nr:ATP-dependent RNA helicase [Clostridia bacterium]